MDKMKKKEKNEGQSKDFQTRLPMYYQSKPSVKTLLNMGKEEKDESKDVKPSETK